MDSLSHGGNEDQYVKYPSVEALGRNFRLRRSKCIKEFHNGMNQDLGLIGSGMMTMFQV